MGRKKSNKEKATSVQIGFIRDADWKTIALSILNSTKHFNPFSRIIPDLTLGYDGGYCCYEYENSSRGMSHIIAKYVSQIDSIEQDVTVFILRSPWHIHEHTADAIEAKCLIDLVHRVNKHENPKYRLRFVVLDDHGVVDEKSLRAFIVRSWPEYAGEPWVKGIF